jgi:hypothetical protein
MQRGDSALTIPRRKIGFVYLAPRRNKTLIISRQSDGIVDLELQTRQPTVYLDNWAMARALARDDSRRTRFIDAFKARGTLFFSWANVLELGDSIFNRSVPIRLLFDGIGEHWFPIEWNPFACIRKEIAHVSGANSPALSESFLRAYYPHIHGGVLTLSAVLDLLRQDNGIKAHSGQDQIKVTVRKFVDEVKLGHSKDPNWLDEECPVLPFDPQRPAVFVFSRLLRALAQESGFTFTPNDGMDLFHATVPAAYSDFVLLDKSWTRRVRTIAMPGRQSYAFSEHELDQFLDAFEQCAIVTRSGALATNTPKHARRENQ